MSPPQLTRSTVCTASCRSPTTSPVSGGGDTPPGSPTGSTVIDGHIDSAAAGAGALFHLAQLNPGQPITITTTTGVVITYRVQARRVYPKAEGLPADLFAQTGPARLVLISCGGTFDTTNRSYDDNLSSSPSHRPTDRHGYIGAFSHVAADDGTDGSATRMKRPFRTGVGGTAGMPRPGRRRGVSCRLVVQPAPRLRGATGLAISGAQQFSTESAFRRRSTKGMSGHGELELGAEHSSGPQDNARLGLSALVVIAAILVVVTVVVLMGVLLL